MSAISNFWERQPTGSKAMMLMGALIFGGGVVAGLIQKATAPAVPTYPGASSSYYPANCPAPLFMSEQQMRQTLEHRTNGKSLMQMLQEGTKYVAEANVLESSSPCPEYAKSITAFVRFENNIISNMLAEGER